MLIPIYATPAWRLRRPSGIYLAYPDRYVEPGQVPEDFDLFDWSKKFEWSQDKWVDAVQPVRKTIKTQTGDCDDYTAVAISCLSKESEDKYGVGICYNEDEISPSHIVAITEDRVYNNGLVHPQSPDEWLKASQYDRMDKNWVKE